MGDRRLSSVQQLSNYLIHEDARSMPGTVAIVNRYPPATSSSLNQATTTTAETTFHAVRPPMIRAATTPAPPTINASRNPSSTPLLSRPILNRAAMASDVAQPYERVARTARSSFLRRATDLVVASFALSPWSDHRDNEKLKAPTYWADHIHRKPLLEIWHKPLGCIRETGSISDQLSAVHDEMLRQYAELGSGDVALTKKWIERVLGLCLREPFSTSRNAGRWQNLATAAGPRGNWGPW